MRLKKPAAALTAASMLLLLALTGCGHGDSSGGSGSSAGGSGSIGSAGSSSAYSSDISSGGSAGSLPPDSSGGTSSSAEEQPSGWTGGDTIALDRFQYAFSGDGDMTAAYSSEWYSEEFAEGEASAQNSALKVNVNSFDARPELYDEDDEDNYHVNVYFALTNISGRALHFRVDSMTVNGFAAVDPLLTDPAIKLNSDDTSDLDPGETAVYTLSARAFACDRNDLADPYIIGFTLRSAAGDDWRESETLTCSFRTDKEGEYVSRYDGLGTLVFDSGTGVKIYALGYVLPDNTDICDEPSALFYAVNDSDEYYQAYCRNDIGYYDSTRPLPAHSRAVIFGELPDETVEAGTPGECDISLYSADTLYDDPAAWELAASVSLNGWPG